MIPQFRWLHEMDRLFPYGQAVPKSRSPAPPSGVRAVQRGPGAACPSCSGTAPSALRRHPLSMEVDATGQWPGGRSWATTTTRGSPRHLAVTVGIDPDERLRHVAQTLGAGWMESVLSWPHRFVLPFDAGTSEPAELAFAEQ